MIDQTAEMTGSTYDGLYYAAFIKESASCTHRGWWRACATADLRTHAIVGIRRISLMRALSGHQRTPARSAPMPSCAHICVSQGVPPPRARSGAARADAGGVASGESSGTGCAGYAAQLGLRTPGTQNRYTKQVF